MVKISRRGKTIQTSIFSRDPNQLYSYPTSQPSVLLNKVNRANRIKTNMSKGPGKWRTGGGF